MIPRAIFERDLQAEARRWVGVPFCFRGYTRRGADCIGVIVGVLRAVGIPLPMDDGQPYEADWWIHDRNRNRYLEGLLSAGRLVEDPPRPGDVLAFWSAVTPKVTHSGLYLGDQTFLHAQRPVGARMNQLTEYAWQRIRHSVVRIRAVEERVAF